MSWTANEKPVLFAETGDRGCRWLLFTEYMLSDVYLLFSITVDIYVPKNEVPSKEKQ